MGGFCRDVGTRHIVGKLSHARKSKSVEPAMVVASTSSTSNPKSLFALSTEFLGGECRCPRSR